MSVNGERTLVAVVLLASCGCARAAEAEGRAPRESKGEVRSPTDQKAEVTPVLARKAEEILQANEGAAVGTEIPFELDGRRYVARIEEHDNPAAEADRPSGKHKGVTVYVAH